MQIAIWSNKMNSTTKICVRRESGLTKAQEKAPSEKQREEKGALRCAYNKKRLRRRPEKEPFGNKRKPPL